MTPRSALPAIDPTAFAATLAGTVGVWAADATAVVFGDPAPPLRPWAWSVATALFLALALGLFVALGVGLFVGLSRRDPLVRRLPAALREWASGGTEGQRRQRVGGVLAAVALAGVFALGSFVGSRELVLRMAQPHFVALAVLAAHLALAAACLACFPFARTGAVALTAPLRRVPPLGRLLVAPGRALAVVAGAFVAAGGAFAVAFREPLAFLPWDPVLRVTLGVGLGLGAFAGLRALVWRRAPRARGAVVATVAALAVTGPFAFLVGPDYLVESDLLSARLLVSRTALRLVRPVLDFDGDGQLSMFGGGDCAPFDPRIYGGAVDVPGNGIDEDCNGSDAVAADGRRLWGIWDHPVPPTVPERPPIILITNDAFAATHMGFYGYERDTTPRLDALAQRSAVFTRAFAQGPSTRLSFPALFTSRWDSEIAQDLKGRHPFPLKAENLMLAEVLRDAGYHTAAVLPAPFFTETSWKGLLQGFAQVEDGPARLYHKEKHNHTGEQVTEAALRVVEAERAAPLFLWVHYFDNHYPHVHPRREVDYGEARVDLYDAELRMVDGHIGRILDAVERRFGGRALVILTSDHGYGFGAPRYAKMGYGYDLHTATLHVPLLFHAPFIEPRRLEGLASTMDILPTLVNLLRLRGRFDFQGVSLVPELLSGETARPQYLFHQFFLLEKRWKDEDPLLAVSVRTPQHNLVIERSRGRPQLFDWGADYLERKNLSSKQVKLRKELEDLLSLYLANAPGLRASATPPAPTAESAPKPADSPSR